MEPLTSEQILAMKAEMEGHVAACEAIAKRLLEDGYNVRGNEKGEMYIYKTHTEGYGEPPRPPKPDALVDPDGKVIA